MSTKIVFILFSLLVFTLSTLAQPFSQREKDSINNAFLKQREKSNADLIGKPFPPFTCLDKGDTVDNNSFKGKTVFINFWFEACAPCIAEFDALNELYDILKSNKNFEFISFTFETEEIIEKMKLKYHLPYKIFSITKKDCYRLNNENGFPTSMIIDSIGLIKYRTSGGYLDKDIAREFIMNTVYPEIVKRL